MNKTKHPRLCVYVAVPYDQKRRIQPDPHMLLRSNPDNPEQFLKDCVSRVPPFVVKKKTGTFYFRLETDANILDERNSRRWSGAFGTTIEEFLQEHLAPFFEQRAQEGQRRAA